MNLTKLYFSPEQEYRLKVEFLILEVLTAYIARSINILLKQ